MLKGGNVVPNPGHRHRVTPDNEEDYLHLYQFERYVMKVLILKFLHSFSIPLFRNYIDQDVLLLKIINEIGFSFIKK